ncbi:SIMPL domain-containing protein [Ectobacillus panaciterrae]|uniref:SIMPL domain-containing protein n=1 Tax=Ectobacillus panaciterrae TaxID=363872 RepID=UPI000417404C|nr:SIMPL domain-containing protein [Ectobacillus panaciterrae]
MHYGPAPYFPEYRPIKDSTLTLQGEGTVQAKPDVVVITLGVSTENENVKTAQEENAVHSAALLNALKALGIQEQEIQTISYTITPEYNYIDGKSILRGYRVEHLYEITVLNVQKAGEVYAAAVQAGANIARGLTFRVSNPDVYYQQALTLAIQQAQEKAKAVVSTLGVTLNPIPISITEEPGAVPRYATYAASSKAVPPIQPGELDITVAIRAVFSYM